MTVAVKGVRVLWILFEESTELKIRFPTALTFKTNIYKGKAIEMVALIGTGFSDCTTNNNLVWMDIFDESRRVAVTDWRSPYWFGSMDIFEVL